MIKVFDIIGGNFEAFYEAKQWCEDRDICVGAMEKGQPCGLLVGPYVVAKWHNLRPHERNELNGKLTGDFRHGPVTIELKGKESDYPIIPERYRQP